MPSRAVTARPWPTLGFGTADETQAGDVLRYLASLTTAANDDMRVLHERMPGILEPGDWPVWLGEAEGDHTALLRPAAAGVVRLWPVSRAVNNVRTKAGVAGAGGKRRTRDAGGGSGGLSTRA